MVETFVPSDSCLLSPVLPVTCCSGFIGFEVVVPETLVSVATGIVLWIPSDASLIYERNARSQSRIDMIRTLPKKAKTKKTNRAEPRRGVLLLSFTVITWLLVRFVVVVPINYMDDENHVLVLATFANSPVRRCAVCFTPGLFEKYSRERDICPLHSSPPLLSLQPVINVRRSHGYDWNDWESNDTKQAEGLCGRKWIDG